MSNRLFVMTLVSWSCACGSVKGKQLEPDAGCIAESDDAFCERSAGACESHTALDNCGMERTADCGGCAGGEGCVTGMCRAPVCTTFDYTSTPLSPFTGVGIGGVVDAVTPDGGVLLSHRLSSDCSEFILEIADETAPGSGLFVRRDLTAAFGVVGLATGDEGRAITADGLTIITANGPSLLLTKRSAIHKVDFGPTSAAGFEEINRQIANRRLRFQAPVISADGLEIFYSIAAERPPDGGEPEEVPRIYSSARASLSVPFPAGKPLLAAEPYSWVTGVSSDRLTLFVRDRDQGRVLTRGSTSEPFTNPNAPALPPVLANRLHRPLADCGKLIAMTSSVGSCLDPEVVLMTRR